VNSIISQPWGVSAFGQGDVHAEPNYVVLRLAINRLNSKPEGALSAARDSASSLRGVVRNLEIPPTDVTSSRTSVQSAWDGYGAGRKFLGYQCRIEFSIRLTDLDLVDRALVELVDAGADEITELRYDNTDKQALRAEARLRAVEAARDKASVYAEAAGVTLGPVVHIEDVDPEQLRSESHRGVGGGSSGASDLAPGRITVSAAVVLGFALNH
jgi:uncharacterized protein YggE